MRLARGAVAGIVKEYTEAMRRMTLDDVAELEALGIPRRAILTVCPAPARIMLNAAGDRFCADPAGDISWIFPICCSDSERPDLIEASDPLCTVAHGKVVDLICFHVARRNRWALRTGAATVLGAIEPQHMVAPEEPVRVHRDVTGWLKDECRGIVILTKDRDDARRILQQIENFTAEDNGHRALLDTLCAPSRRRAA
jgi:hypothetical protein